MLNILFNNQKLVVKEQLNLEQLLNDQAYVQNHFAVAINQHFIPRARYAETYLQEGDVIETVAPMQGG